MRPARSIGRLAGRSATVGRSLPIRGGLCAAVLVLASACGSTTDRDVVRDPALAPELATYLASPWEGYLLAIDPALRADLQSGFEELRRVGDVDAARRAAQRVEQVAGALVPAEVLRAQADFVAGDSSGVLARLVPADSGLAPRTSLIEATLTWPGALVLGRAAELEARPDVAHAAYRLAAESAEPARRGAERTLEAALQFTLRGLAAALAEDRLEAARAAVQRMEEWAPGADVTLRARLDLARAIAEPAAELAALRAWIPRQPTVGNYKRLGHLEVEYGDAERGLQVYTQLAEQLPNDPEVADGLAAAQFVWRLDMLPAEVRQIVDRERLSRGDFAELLYWLLPGVRTRRPESGQIVTDLPLEHPQRAAIVRVVNLGLMPLQDATLREFAADEPITRRQGFAVLLELPEYFGTEAQCTAELAGRSRPSGEEICVAAARCRIVADVSECRLPDALAGRVAREGLRRMLALLEQAP
ncbi:MAG: hypothetical protein DWQ36_23850 [Acidobacteria bacterium]|nr:MAG: hypothetical protein DWQ30_07045 [Acidobacteriota bacterium]REK00188.1 MAG: hypothetical protein DWQ36_23850 [Acidobacteriota bacterium]